MRGRGRVCVPLCACHSACVTRAAVLGRPELKAASVAAPHSYHKKDECHGVIAIFTAAKKELAVRTPRKLSVAITFIRY